MRWNTDFTGWARIAMTLSWISRVSCSSSSRPMATAGRAGEARLDDALRQHGLVDHQLADEIDQPVDALEVDADGGGGRRDLGFLDLDGFELGRLRPWPPPVPAPVRALKAWPAWRARLPPPAAR